MFVVQLVVVGCSSALGATVRGPGDEKAVRQDENGDQSNDATDDYEHEVLGEGRLREVGGAGSGRDGWRGIVVASWEGGEVEWVVGVGAYCRETGRRDVGTAGGGFCCNGGAAGGGCID